MVKSWNIQLALYSALSADTALMAMITGVYDQPDQNAPMPYITIGEDTNVPDDLLSNTGSQNTHTLHVWSKKVSMKETKQIMDQIVTVLHRAALAIPGGTQAVDCALEFAETFRDSDGVTRHGVLRFRVRTFEP